MANLILKKTKIKRKWQKRVRVSTVFAVGFILATVLAAASMAPIAIYTNIVNAGLVDNEQGKVVVNLGRQRQVTKLKLEAYKKFVDSVASIYNQPDISAIVESIVKEVNSAPGAELSAIEISSNGSGYIMRITGSADTRSTVVHIQQVLSTNNLVVVEDFPVSNFAQRDGSYSFTATLVINNLNQNE